MPSDINYADRLCSKEFLTDSVLPPGLLWQVAMCQAFALLVNIINNSKKAQTCTLGSVLGSTWTSSQSGPWFKHIVFVLLVQIDLFLLSFSISIEQRAEKEKSWWVFFLMWQGHGGFLFSCFEDTLLSVPHKVLFKPHHFKARPLLPGCLACLASRWQYLSAEMKCWTYFFFFPQHGFLKIRMLCKMMVGLSTECKVKWKLVEHHCTVLCSWPMGQQKKEWDTKIISS